MDAIPKASAASEIIDKSVVVLKSATEAFVHAASEPGQGVDPP